MAAIVAPRFTRRFRRMCQIAAISGTGRSREVIDGMLPVVMVYSDGPWRRPLDWKQAINDLFGLDLPESDLREAISRADREQKIKLDRHSSEYELDRDLRKSIEDSIDKCEHLELRAQASWLSEVEHLVSEVPSDALWSCLIAYAGKAFLSHGLDALKLLDGESRGFEDLPVGETPEALLKAAMGDTGLDEAAFPEISDAVRIFFNGKNHDRVGYIAELVSGTFNFLALNLDDETRESLLANIPSLTIFVDTNVIYGIIGAQAGLLGEVAIDLFKVLRENAFPFKLYYHEKTLRELEYTITAIGTRLRRRQWSSALSRAMLTRQNMISSIEVRYHEINSRTPTAVDVYLGRYSNIPLLLAEYNINIFREGSSSQEEDYKRGELVAEYQAFLAENAKGHSEKAYKALDHDITIWMAASDRQIPRKKGPLFSGALIISADNVFRRFDREILSRDFGSGTWIVTRPDTLLRAVRPFISTSQHSEEVFAQLFATPEFRSLGRNYYPIVDRVASYLATYDNLPEETATKLLANDMLMHRLKNHTDSGDEFERLIQEELVRENELLVKERDEAVEAARKAARQRVWLRSQVEELVTQRRADYDVYADLKRLMENLSGFAGEKSDINIGGIYVNETNSDYSGGYYENNQSQIGAQGTGSQASNFSQQADQRKVSVDLATLVTELEVLKNSLIEEAENAEQYQVVAEVQAAREAASTGDVEGTSSHLARAGRWALEVATHIGAPVAAVALQQALGIGA
ncbi:hypothetical protein ACFHW2_40025 [Actinomadura sp. LOL_016]|uniref:hypothetical protein n=1 Tax=unclassified Actinomadura TaxID=2626254 RepID=UPI003A80D08E